MHGYIYIHIYIFIYLFMCVHVFLHRHNRCSHHSECISKLDAIPLHWTPPLRNSHRSIPTGLLQCVSRICMALVCLSQCLDTKNMYQKDGKSLEVTPGDLTLFRSVVGWMETETFYVWPTKTTLSSLIQKKLPQNGWNVQRIPKRPCFIYI